MCALVYMASRDKVEVEAFHKLKAFNTHWKELLKSKRHKGSGMRLLIIPELRVLALTKTHMSLIYMYFSAK